MREKTVEFIVNTERLKSKNNEIKNLLFASRLIEGRWLAFANTTTKSLPDSSMPRNANLENKRVVDNPISDQKVCHLQ